MGVLAPRITAVGLALPDGLAFEEWQAAGERIVHLKADRNTQALLFEPVIEAIAEAGGDLVHILEDERQK